MVIFVGNGHGDTSSNPGRASAIEKALIPLGKVWIKLFSLKLWVDSRRDWVPLPWLDNHSRRKKTIQTCLTTLKNDSLTSCLSVGVGKKHVTIYVEVEELQFNGQPNHYYPVPLWCLPWIHGSLAPWKDSNISSVDLPEVNYFEKSCSYLINSDCTSALAFYLWHTIKTNYFIHLYSLLKPPG